MEIMTPFDVSESSNADSKQQKQSQTKSGRIVGRQIENIIIVQKINGYAEKLEFLKFKMEMKIPKEWTINKITYSGRDRKRQMRSLRKKKFRSQRIWCT